MTPLDAMKQALEALEEANPNLSPYGRADRLVNESITTLASAIAELEKAEPVAWYGVTGDYGFPFLSFQEQQGMTPLYTHPKETQEQLTGEK